MIYNQSLALLTDLYQLTMVYGYWKAQMAETQAVFHLHFRRWPFQGGFALAAGLATAVEFLQKLKFSPDDLAYLKTLDLFETPFLDFLSQFKFECDVDAMPEGTLVFPYEPLLRVKGPLWQAQLLESPMLNLINFQTLIATKAARICMEASPDPVIEFGMRRAQGIDGAISASRAAFIGGCESTSDVIAGKLFNIPIRGTHAHSWIMAFDDEKQAFEVFAKMRPKNCIMLIDTYHSIEGAKRAIQVAKSIKNFEFAGVRLDSGDLAQLSIEIRKLLDAAGFPNTRIMASNELDEYLIRDLKQQGAKINLWGVGTHLVTGKEQPALDGVYKLSAIQNPQKEWVHKIKLSEQTAKVTNPGILQVRRFFDGTHYTADLMYDELLGISGEGQDLLQPIFRKGKCIYKSPTLQEIQAHGKQELSRLKPSMRRLVNPELYPTDLEAKLYEKKRELIDQYRKDIDSH